MKNSSVYTLLCWPRCNAIFGLKPAWASFQNGRVLLDYKRPDSLAVVETPRMDTPVTTNFPTPPLRVLLVDDHEDTNRSLLLLLRRRGYEAKTATSIATAIEVAGTQDFDVLVSDMGLPDGSGLDLLSQMPTPPALGGIMVSGYSMDEDIERSKAAGYREYLSKPVSVDKLDTLIRKFAAEGAQKAG